MTKAEYVFEKYASKDKTKDTIHGAITGGLAGYALPVAASEFAAHRAVKAFKTGKGNLDLWSKVIEHASNPWVRAGLGAGGLGLGAFLGNKFSNKKGE